MSKPRPLKTDFRAHDRLLVIALAAGPLSALTNLSLSYALAPESCQQGTKLWLHVSFAVFVGISVASALIARRIASRFDARSPDPLVERTRWQATAALILSISSVVLLIAMEIPNLILRSCD